MTRPGSPFRRWPPCGGAARSDEDGGWLTDDESTALRRGGLVVTGFLPMSVFADVRRCRDRRWFTSFAERAGFDLDTSRLLVLRDLRRGFFACTGGAPCTLRGIQRLHARSGPGGLMLGERFPVCRSSSQSLNGTIRTLSLLSVSCQTLCELTHIIGSKTPMVGGRWGISLSASNRGGRIPCNRSGPGG